MPQPFNLPIRVYYEDTDAGCVVYHANYARFFERARTEWLRQAGFDQRELAAQGILFAVRALTMRYHKPAHLDDHLRVQTSARAAGRSRALFCQQLWRDNDLLTDAEAEVVCVCPAPFRPRPLPEKLRALMQTAAP